MRTIKKIKPNSLRICKKKFIMQEIVTVQHRLNWIDKRMKDPKY